MAVIKNRSSWKERTLGIVGLLLIGVIGLIADRVAGVREGASRVNAGQRPRVGASHGR